MKEALAATSAVVRWHRRVGKQSMFVVRIITFLLGLGITLSTLFSAIKTTVLPGRKKVRLSRTVFRNTFRLFRFVSMRVRAEEQRDSILAMYAPTSAMLLPLTWIILLILGDSACSGLSVS